MPEINFLIPKKIFENFSRSFVCLKEKENRIFEENVRNCSRKNFYEKDSCHYQSVMNGTYDLDNFSTDN